MTAKIGLKATAATLGLVAALAIAPASAAGVKVGVLSCTVHSGWGFVFGSSKDLWCNFIRTTTAKSTTRAKCRSSGSTSATPRAG